MNISLSEILLTFLFYQNLTLLALFGAMIAIIVTLPSISLKSLLLRDILQNELTIKLVVLITVNLLISLSYNSLSKEFLITIPFLSQLIIYFFIIILNIGALFLFLSFAYNIPNLVNPINFFERICNKLPNTFVTLQNTFKELFTTTKLSYYRLDYFSRMTIDAIPFIDNNQILSNISALYHDIIVNSDYTQMRKATKILATKLIDFAKPEYDRLYCDILIPKFFIIINEAFSHNLDRCSIVILLDEAGKLLQKIYEKGLFFSFVNNSHSFRNTYEEMFKNNPNLVNNSIEVTRLLKPYRELCLSLGMEINSSILFSNMITILEKLFDNLGCKYLTYVLYEFVDDLQILFIKQEDILVLKNTLAQISILLESDKLAFCEIVAKYSFIDWLIIMLRRTQDKFRKENVENTIKKYDIIEKFINKQIILYQRHFSTKDGSDFDFRRITK